MYTCIYVCVCTCVAGRVHVGACVFGTGITAVAAAAAAAVLWKCVTEVWNQLPETENTVACAL